MKTKHATATNTQYYNIHEQSNCTYFISLSLSSQNVNYITYLNST